MKSITKNPSEQEKELIELVIRCFRTRIPNFQPAFVRRLQAEGEKTADLIVAPATLAEWAILDKPPSLIETASQLAAKFDAKLYVTTCLDSNQEDLDVDFIGGIDQSPKEESVERFLQAISAQYAIACQKWQRKKEEQ
jgi:hypothetical protein